MTTQEQRSTSTKQARREGPETIGQFLGCLVRGTFRSGISFEKSGTQKRTLPFPLMILLLVFFPWFILGLTALGWFLGYQYTFEGSF